MRQRSAGMSLRWHLICLVVGAQLPWVALLLGLARDRPGHVTATVAAATGALLVTLAMVLAVVLERRTVAFISSIAVGARAVAQGETPLLGASTIRELDEVARALERAGVARREAEERLRSGEARLAAILGSAMDAIIAVDANRHILLFNRAAQEMFGCAPADVIGTPIDRFVSLAFRRALSAPRHVGATTASATALRAPGDLTAFRADGRQFPVEATVSYVAAGGQTITTLILRDVTERKRAEQERLELLRREQAARAEAEAAARLAAFFADASRLLTASLDYAASLTALARLAAGTIADWCVIDLLEDDGTVRRLTVAHADPARDDLARALQLRHAPGVDGPETVRRVLHSGTSELVAVVAPEDVERRARSADHLRLLRGLGLQSLMVVPMRARGRTLGAITLVRAGAPAYDEDDLAAAEELAHRAAMAVDNARLYRHADEAHARFAGLVEGLDAIVWEANPVTLEFTFVSQRAEAWLGYPVDRWLNQGDFWAAMIHAEDREAALAEFRRCARDLVDGRFEYRAMAADGRVVWLSNVLRVVRQADGSVARLHGFMLDVTQRKRIEDERKRLLRSEQEARAEAETAALRARFLAEASQVLASSLDYEVTLDAVTRLAVPTFADWCFVRLADDANGPQRVQAASADPQAAGVADTLRRLAPALEVGSLAPMLGLLQDGQSLLLPDISPAWLETARLLQEMAPRSAMIVPLVARGRPLGTLVFIWSQPDRHYGPADLALAEDLAHRAATAVDNARLYREAERANRAKDEFVATLSHELRTPLTAMLGWAAMLKSGRLAPSGEAQAVASIERNTRLQARLIDELLDVSRIVSRKLLIDKAPVDLRRVLEDAVDCVSPDAEAKQIALRAQADAVSVLGDAGRLEQVIVNLLTNAVKFTPERGVIDVTVDRHGASARIVVTDTGQGIAPEVLPHVFERFRQADGTSTRRQGGLGLGLAIVHHLVALHGGTVQARSAGHGCGATFEVMLPVLAVQPAVEEPAALPPARLPRLENVRVLVVDDHGDSRELVRTVLADCGAEVLLAASVDEALGVLRAAYVDVLVSDIGMPDADGYDLIRRLREHERDHGGRIPGVALTAYAGTDDRERAFAAGFDWHVTKPIGPGELADVVAKAAGRPALS